jgi:hypothetical protein
MHLKLDQHPNWKGADAGYDAKHGRVYRLRGPARLCVWGCEEEVTRYEWANLTGDYDDLYDFVQMCALCHHRFDNAVRSVLRSIGVPDDDLVDYVAEHPGLSGAELSRRFGWAAYKMSARLRQTVRAGQLRFERRGQVKKWFLVE